MKRFLDDWGWVLRMGLAFALGWILMDILRAL